MRNKLFLACALVLVFCATLALCCDEGVCVSIVSKCLLIKSCDCDMTSLKNCTCCKDCQLCLSKLYTECCSCVGLCPKPDPDDDLRDGSTVDDLNDPIPELFNVLTEQPDVEKRWTTFSHPMHFDALLYKPNRVLDLSKDIRQEATKDSYGSELNCTVAFMSQCYSLRKCKESCKSMGATRYRWFHDHGCCQCIGNNCISYGLNGPKCLQCPPQDEETENQLQEEVNKLVENSVIEEEDFDEEFDMEEEEEEDFEEDRGINELKTVG